MTRPKMFKVLQEAITRLNTICQNKMYEEGMSLEYGKCAKSLSKILEVLKSEYTPEPRKKERWKCECGEILNGKREFLRHKCKNTPLPPWYAIPEFTCYSCYSEGCIECPEIKTHNGSRRKRLESL